MQCNAMQVHFLGLLSLEGMFHLMFHAIQGREEEEAAAVCTNVDCYSSEIAASESDFVPARSFSRYTRCLAQTGQLINIRIILSVVNNTIRFDR